jgi:hypothetical protein
VAEHLDAEAVVEVVDDALLSGAPHDLRRQPSGRPRLRHDVVGDAVSTLDQLLAEGPAWTANAGSALLAALVGSASETGPPR